MKIQKSKKGQISIGQLAGLAVTFVIVTIVVAFGATIVADVQTSQTSGSYAYNTSEKGLESLEKFGTNLPTLAIVVVAAVIIGVLASAFVLSR